MRIELHGPDRLRAAPLFAGLPGAHAIVSAGLSGEFGQLWVDDVDRPSVAHLHLDFHFLGGAAESAAAPEFASAILRPSGLMMPTDWTPILREIHGDAFGDYERVSFGEASFDRAQLRRFTEALPVGYTLQRVPLDLFERFTAFEYDLTRNFRDAAHFIDAGFGFAVLYHDEIVAGCSSFTLWDGLAEVEIDTAAEHRRRGLALATGAALVLHCLDHGLTPCWDAANPESAALATRLGFTQPLRYRAWFLRKPA